MEKKEEKVIKHLGSFYTEDPSILNEKSSAVSTHIYGNYSQIENSNVRVVYHVIDEEEIVYTSDDTDFDLSTVDAEGQSVRQQIRTHPGSYKSLDKPVAAVHKSEVKPEKPVATAHKSAVNPDKLVVAAHISEVKPDKPAAAARMSEVKPDMQRSKRVESDNREEENKNYVTTPTTVHKQEAICSCKQACRPGKGAVGGASMFGKRAECEKCMVCTKEQTCLRTACYRDYLQGAAGYGQKTFANIMNGQAFINRTVDYEQGSTDRAQCRERYEQAVCGRVERETFPGCKVGYEAALGNRKGYAGASGWKKEYGCIADNKDECRNVSGVRPGTGHSSGSTENSTAIPEYREGYGYVSHGEIVFGDVSDEKAQCVCESRYKKSSTGACQKKCQCKLEYTEGYGYVSNDVALDRQIGNERQKGGCGIQDKVLKCKLKLLGQDEATCFNPDEAQRYQSNTRKSPYCDLNYTTSAKPYSSGICYERKSPVGSFTDWNKCFICQEHGTEYLCSPSQDGCDYGKLAEDIIANIINGNMNINLQRVDNGCGVENTLRENRAKYHQSCKLQYKPATFSTLKERQRALC